MKNTNKKIQRKFTVQNKKKDYDTKVIKLIIEAQKYYDNKKLEQANCLYQQALHLEPKNILVLNGLGLVAMQAGMMPTAVEFFNSACELSPDNLTINKNLALAYTRMSQFNDAILHYICILGIDENNSDAHTELAKLNLQVDNLDIALSHFRRAFELNPEDPQNLHGIAQLDSSVLTEQDIATIEKLLDRPDLSLAQRCSFYFSLGCIHDASGRFDEAFANYFVANISKCEIFNKEKHTDNITGIINSFTAEVFAKFKDCELSESSQPVFVVGMPCSGINLVEKILSRNSHIYSAGEINQIHDISQNPGIFTDSDFIEASLINFSRYYLNHINNLASNSGNIKPEKIINISPENYQHLGLISLLFPKAHIIHCVRSPLDVCLSNYFENFTDNNRYSYDQENIAHYYQQYERLMAHWKSVLPVNIHTVYFEDLVKFPETTSRQMFRFINVDWQPECISFLLKNRSVKATALAQVERNKYKTSLEHWQHYKEYLHFLVKDLSVDASGNPVKAQ